MQILKLTVHKMYFHMLKTGIKKEEYREAKVYWLKRLVLNYSVLCDADKQPTFKPNFKKFDAVEFKNGYGNNKPTLLFEFKSTRIDNDYKLKWGGDIMLDAAGHKTPCFIIALGKELSRANC